MTTQKRRGRCKACRIVERTRTRVLAVANPPFSHADQGAVDVWNRTLAENPCEEPTRADRD